MCLPKTAPYINVINHVDMETYLIGVVPYEIGENYNINALKAQAVCARSYSYDRLSGSTSITSYDIGDTSSDQVYRGYNSSYTNCIQAVMERPARCSHTTAALFLPSIQPQTAA